MHVSGHACSEELRTLLSLVRPRAVMPIHGEYRMLAAHAQLARDAGVPGGGDRDRRERLGRRADAARRADRRPRSRPASRSSTGSASATSQDVALRDRRRLSEDGVLIVVTTVALVATAARSPPPELIARGFGEDEELLDELRDEADRDRPRSSPRNGVTEIKLLQEHIHDAIGQLVYDRTRRRPMILPVVIEV